MPALLERPKLSNAMARALHRHIMMERERKRQEEEEVDKMMEQKMKEEQERRKKKEMEERMSLEETKEQTSFHCLHDPPRSLNCKRSSWPYKRRNTSSSCSSRKFYMRRRKGGVRSKAYQQGLAVHTGTHLLSMQGSPGGHSRPGTLMSADRAKQMFGPQVLTLLQEPQNTGNSRAVQEGPMGQPSPHLTMDLPSRAIVPANSSEPLQLFLLFSTCHNLSHSPMQYTATTSLHKQGSCNLAMPCPFRSSWNMLTSNLASLIRPLCAPCIPRLYTQPLGF
ncbi:G protein pathway suppressor 2 isoform X3 [Phascolarctos cinereus]